MKFNIYAPSLMGNRILSPLNRKAQVHYHYLLERVEHRLGGELYCIRVVPRYRSTQLVEGFLWLSSADWTIRRMNLKGRYDLVRFQLSMQMGEEEDTKYLPVLLNLDLNFKFLKNHLEMKYTGWMKYSSVVYRKPGRNGLSRKRTTIIFRILILCRVIPVGSWWNVTRSTASVRFLCLLMRIRFTVRRMSGD